MKTKIPNSNDNNDYNLIIEKAIEEFRLNSFIEVWEKSITDIINEEDITINSLVIGKVGELSDRIYVGANTNKVLVFDLNGTFYNEIVLGEGDKVKQLEIIDVTNHSGNELLIQTCDDTILFYNYKKKGDFEEQQYLIRDRTTSITALFAIKNSEEYAPIFVGDSNGNVLKNSYLNLSSSGKALSIIPDTEKLIGETIAAISGSAKLLNNNFGLLVGYRNGLVLLMNNNNEVISKFDIDREIENIYMIEKNQSIIITTDDSNLYHFSVKDDVLTNDWIYYFSNTISTIIPNSQVDSDTEFFVLSEDSGTISSFDKNGKFVLTGDPSFEGTTGVFYEQHLFLASREGEISQFAIISHEKKREINKRIQDSYFALCQTKEGNSFYEFFNSEFESEENVEYFKLFLINYLTDNPEKRIDEKIIELFSRKRYNTNTAEGLIRKIISSSQLKSIFLEKFKGTSVSNEILDFLNEIEKKRNETNLFNRAELILKKDILKYIELMCELRIHKLDKMWMNSILEDDHVIGIKLYHDPLLTENFQILIATQKGSVLLLDRQTGQIIWSFKLEREVGTITNVDVADICSDGFLEIVLGLENSQNSIVILSTNKEKFNSGNNEVELKWTIDNELNKSFKLFLTKCNVSGINYDAIHNVKCFDFDNNGVQDLIISSENGKFDIFYFDNNRSKILPRTKSIEPHEDEDDIMVFELVRDDDQQINLYTGSASGNIEKLIYEGGKFIYKGRSFTERDAKVTDILYAEVENENVVLFSSEDNFVYCLNCDLEYKWAYKTGGDVKSIGVSKFNNQDLIFTISDDGYLYVLDAFGNKKWSYFFMAKDGSPSPLDQLYVEKDELIVADSDGSVHLLHLKDTIEIINKMDDDLASSDVIFLSLLDSSIVNVRIYAIRKLLSANPDSSILKKIALLLNDENEPEEIVRCETIKLLTRYLSEMDSFSLELSKLLVDTLKDLSPEVRMESVKSFFLLIDKHQLNTINISNCLVEIADDENVWVKEYFAGALNKFETTGEESNLAKWKALSALLKLNIEEDWILNEAASSIGHFLSNISNVDLLTSFINELFEYDFEDETFERILNKIPSNKIASLYSVYFQIVFGNSAKIKEAYDQFLKECSDQDQKNYKILIDFVKSFLNIIDQILLDDVINDGILKTFSKFLNNSLISFNKVISNLDNYLKENNISEKIVSLNFATDSIKLMANEKSKLKIIDKRLYEFAIEGHLLELISKRSRWHMESVDLDIEMENREVILNDDGIADINFNIINKGYNKVEEIEISINKETQTRFEIIEEIDEIGELVRLDKKKVFFKIKPKAIETLDIIFVITFKGCLIPIIDKKRVFVKESIKKEWVYIPNPYTSGIPIENDDVFVGRESLIHEAITAIKKDPVFVMGHRRMGKTSLIKYIQRHYLNTEEYISVFVSAEKIVLDTTKDFLFSFCYPITEELEYLKIFNEDDSEKYLNKIRENGLIDFGVFFNKVLKTVRRLNKTLVLIIDEYPIIHEAVENGKIDAQFISNLRGYMQNNSKEFKMIYSGASSLKYLKSQYSSNIMGVGKSIEVSFLDEPDVRKLISYPLNNQMKFEDSAFQYLMEITYGQPFLVQVCLSYLVDKLNKDKKSSMVFKDTIEDGLNYFLEQAPHLQDDWNSRVYSKDLRWTENEEKIARIYKQLIITSITDKWKKTKSGLSNEELLLILEGVLKEFHVLNRTIFDEVINILVGSEDLLKLSNNMYFIKVGLFREWVIKKMNLSFNKTSLEIKDIIINL